MQPITWSNFDPVPPPKRKGELLTVTINERFILTAKPELVEQLKNRRAGLFISKDGYYLILAPNREPFLQFPKQAGWIRMEAFAADLMRRGIRLPAKYVVDWEPDEEVWLGKCVSQPIVPPAIAAAQGRKSEKVR